MTYLFGGKSIGVCDQFDFLLKKIVEKLEPLDVRLGRVLVFDGLCSAGRHVAYTVSSVYCAVTAYCNRTAVLQNWLALELVVGYSANGVKTTQILHRSRSGRHWLGKLQQYDRCTNLTTKRFHHTKYSTTERSQC